MRISQAVGTNPLSSIAHVRCVAIGVRQTRQLARVRTLIARIFLVIATTGVPRTLNADSKDGITDRRARFSAVRARRARPGPITLHLRTDACIGFSRIIGERISNIHSQACVLSLGACIRDRRIRKQIDRNRCAREVGDEDRPPAGESEDDGQCATPWRVHPMVSAQSNRNSSMVPSIRSVCKERRAAHATSCGVP